MNVERRTNGNELLRRWTRCIAVAVLVISAGCSTTARLPNAGAGVLSMRVEFENAAGEPSDSRPSDSALWLGAIAGGLYGTTQNVFKTQGIGKSPTVAIPLSELESLSETNALAMSSTAGASGWRLAPEDTKLLRIATAVLSDEAGWHSATTGFADAVTKKTLMLVYFNRPCRLSGTVVTRLASGVDLTTGVDVIIENAGLNWLEITKSGDANSKIRHAPASVQPIVTAQSTGKTASMVH